MPGLRGGPRRGARVYPSAPARLTGEAPMQPGARRPNLGPLEWEEIRARAEGLEDAWVPGIDLTQFLPPPGAPLRPAVLEELIKTDLEIRWRRGARTGLRDYLQRY